MGYRLRYIWLLVLGWMSLGTIQAEYKVTLKESSSGNKHVTAFVEGVKVDFTFDTGCSSLTVNRDIFENLVKKGAVQWSDLSEVSEAELANGEMHDVRTFTIKYLKIGDYVMRNVRASLGVNDRPDADPLFGQSIFGRLESYTIRGNEWIFTPKPEDEQKALALAGQFCNDTTFAANKRMADALRPFAERLSPRHLIIYAQALEYSNLDGEAIPVYEQLLKNTAYFDEEGKIQKRLLNARLNYADQLYNKEAYAECEEALKTLMRESKKEPVYERGLEYAYSTLCYLYWQTKEYSKAEQATLNYANYLLAPHTWEWLEHHAIEPNADLARLLEHLGKWYRHNDNEEKAKKYEKLAKNAGL